MCCVVGSASLNSNQTYVFHLLATYVSDGFNSSSESLIIVTTIPDSPIAVLTPGSGLKMLVQGTNFSLDASDSSTDMAFTDMTYSWTCTVLSLTTDCGFDLPSSARLEISSAWLNTTYEYEFSVSVCVQDLCSSVSNQFSFTEVGQSHRT